jgi:hypothetical protein
MWGRLDLRSGCRGIWIDRHAGAADRSCQSSCRARRLPSVHARCLPDECGCFSQQKHAVAAPPAHEQEDAPDASALCQNMKIDDGTGGSM